MDSLDIGIYDYEEVLYTLAWLSACDKESAPRKITKRACELGLINIFSDKEWKVNENNVWARLRNPKIKFPDHLECNAILKIMIGLGEMSARSHGKFEGFVSNKVKGFLYQRALIKICNDIAEKQLYCNSMNTVEGVSYSSPIEEMGFDWQGFDESLAMLSYRRVFPRNYGLSLAVKVFVLIIPCYFSMIVNKYKDRSFIEDLCRPFIDPLQWRDYRYIFPLLKCNNPYLKMIACASLVQQEPQENQSSIESNIEDLKIAGIEIGDAIWLLSVKLKQQYQTVRRLHNKIKEVRLDIALCENDESHCPKGAIPAQWLEAQKESLHDSEELFATADNSFKESLLAIKKYWPIEGLSKQQISNIVNLIKSEGLCLELAGLAPNKDGCALIKEGVLAPVWKWLGVSNNSILGACKDSFTYSKKIDFERLVSAAKSIVLLSSIKDDSVIGRELGRAVGKPVSVLEDFVLRPYMSVRKPSLWQSAMSRLACIHMLAMLVFKNTPPDKESQISGITSDVIDKVGIVFKIKSASLSLVKEELFNDLKALSADVVVTQSSLTNSAKDIALDEDMPSDYRVRVIAGSEIVIHNHSASLLKLFEEFGQPPVLHASEMSRNFNQWLCLLDLCLANCVRFNIEETAECIVRIWEQQCSKYGVEFKSYSEYAKNLLLAITGNEDKARWLNGLYGFENSYCTMLLCDSRGASPSN